jgi:toxin FitB
MPTPTNGPRRSYILDSDVLTVVSGSRTNKNVSAWYDALDESDIFLSVVAIKEQAKNAVKLRKEGQHRNANQVEGTLAKLRLTFAGRILALDAASAETWGRMLGDKDAHTLDTAIAAIAKHGGFTIATRNVRHYAGRGVTVIDPFKRPPQIPEVA